MVHLHLLRSTEKLVPPSPPMWYECTCTQKHAHRFLHYCCLEYSNLRYRIVAYMTQINGFPNQTYNSSFSFIDRAVYFGEYPLSFAACLGQVDCVRLLIAKNANPNLQDNNGNTVMHMLVIHDNEVGHMYTFCFKLSSCHICECCAGLF